MESLCSFTLNLAITLNKRDRLRSRVREESDPGKRQTDVGAHFCLSHLGLIHSFTRKLVNFDN